MINRQLVEALAVAQALRSEDGENPEYDRALCELIADIYGLTKFEVANALGISLPIGERQCPNTK